MAIRSFTLTTAAGLGLALALQADAGQANVSLATGSAATTAPTASDAGGGHHRRRVDRPRGADAAARRAAPRPPRKPAPSVTGGVNVDLFSHYVWRGFALTDGFAFQPSVFVSTKGLTVTSWSSWSSTDAGCFDADDCPALREHDFTVDYTKPVGKATVSVGYINYLFPPYRTDDAKAADAVGVTNEIYGGVTFTAPGNPFVKAYVDVDGDDGRRRHVARHLPAVRRQPADSAGRRQGDAHADVLARLQLQAVDRRERLERRQPRRQGGHSRPARSPSRPAVYLSIGLNDTVQAVGYGDRRSDAKFYGGVGFSYAF